MRKVYFSISFLSFMLISNLLFSQERPKIGLVLSGGGAKGMAHIGVLKELESLGIKPDYITGTSMGSIVGGLYAAGYTATEIEKIALAIDWDALLSNQVNLDKILYEEKQYYQRYIIELGISGFSIELPKGLIEGQKLSELLSYLTRHVQDINDFDDLPIPFACVGTDIVTGEPVVMREGSLATALRASMAIPSVFTPVKRDGHFMVDGGLVRNFPVEECLAMGADIIIGVFVSDDLLPEDELKSAVDVLTQSAFVMSVFDSRKQKEKCDLLIEPVMAPYSTYSFDGTPAIIKRGEEAGEKNRGELKALADSLGFTPGIQTIRPSLEDSVAISDIYVSNNKVIPDDFIIGRLRLSEKRMISFSEIEQRIEALYGTRYFNKISYSLGPNGDSSILLIDTDEATPRKLKLGLHFDSENGAGLNINLTARDFLPASRALVEVDIAETFRVDINFLKYIQSTQNWAVKTGINYRNGDIPISDGNVQSAVFKNDFLNPYLTLFSTSRRNNIKGIRIQHERSVLTPKIATGELRQLDRLQWNSWSVVAEFNHNSFDKQFFPTKGYSLGLEGKYSFGINYQLTLVDSLNTFKTEITPPNFFSFNINHHHRWALSDKITIGLQDGIIMNFIKRETDIEFIAPFYNDQVFTGGYRPLLKNSLPFWGADQLAFLTDHIFYNEILLQYQPVKDVYLEVTSQYMNSLYPMKWIYGDIDEGVNEFTENVTSIWGYGAKLSYMSILGPVSVGIASHTETTSWNPFFSIGFYF